MFGNNKKRRKKEEAELALYTKETNLKKQIAVLDKEYSDLTRKLSTLQEGTSAYKEAVANLKKKKKELDNHKASLVTIQGVKDNVGVLGGGSIIPGTLDDFVTEAMRDIDILTSSEDDEGEKISDKEKMAIRMRLEKKMKVATANKISESGMSDWAGIIPENDDDIHEMDDDDFVAQAMADLAEKNKSKSPQKNPVDANWD